MALALNNLKKVDMTLNKETKPIHVIIFFNFFYDCEFNILVEQSVTMYQIVLFKTF